MVKYGKEYGMVLPEVVVKTIKPSAIDANEFLEEAALKKIRHQRGNPALCCVHTRGAQQS